MKQMLDAKEWEFVNRNRPGLASEPRENSILADPGDDEGKRTNRLSYHHAPIAERGTVAQKRHTRPPVPRKSFWLALSEWLWI
jgi:hypothetical protein